MKGSLVLDEETIRKKIKRIAYEIFERHFDQEELILIGICDKGYPLARIIKEELEALSPIKIRLVQLNIDKLDPTNSKVELSEDVKNFSDKPVILVDDVMNTASTLMYSLKPFLHIPVSKIEVAVLVNRSHTKYPILPSYTGYELSTTLEEHIDFVINDSELKVYLR
ncbi:MAG: phosphoribosyltransferase family protein [Bacteroidota bacterium]